MGVEVVAHVDRCVGDDGGVAVLERAAQLREVLLRRYGRSARFEIRVVTTLVVSAMVAAMDEWLESDGKADVRRLVKRALDTVEFGAASA